MRVFGIIFYEFCEKNFDRNTLKLFIMRLKFYNNKKIRMIINRDKNLRTYYTSHFLQQRVINR